MSRIPPPMSGVSKSVKKIQDENTGARFKIPTVKHQAVNKAAGLKRAAEPRLPLTEKKQRMDLDAPVSRLRGVHKPPSRNKDAAFSGGVNRGVLPPIPDNGNLLRGSLPANVLSGKPKKRPAWDLKGRIQDMEENFTSETKKNMELVERIAALESANLILDNDVKVKATLTEEAAATIANLEKELRNKNEEISALSDIKKELLALKKDHEQLQRTYEEETAVLKSKNTSLICEKSGLQAENASLNVLVNNLQVQNQELSKQNSELKKRIEDNEENISELKSKLLAEESIKRKMHNTIQELKGNIRVYCRMRPALPEEIKNGMQFAEIVCPDPKTIEIYQSSDYCASENGKSKKKSEFSFDAVFTDRASQQEVFDEISQLVQSAIDGYNVCIFAYGQTGSGKTFTMEGPGDMTDFSMPDREHQLGMIPRSVRQIFDCVRGLEPRGWKYTLEAFFLQIYNEKIHDLLNRNSLNGNTKCEIIKSSSNGNDVVLSNVTSSPVTCAEEVFKLLKKARINRSVAATKCNEHSSRSHYVFQLKISGKNSVTGENCDGILNLVDLAGSERIKDSGSAGDRLKEAMAINKSLSNLGKVIMSLSKRENHIPYRDSKLTHLLANSLGGNSKTLMFVNISPDNENVFESINSLRFATQVNQTNIGTAQKRIK